MSVLRDFDRTFPPIPPTNYVGSVSHDRTKWGWYNGYNVVRLRGRRATNNHLIRHPYENVRKNAYVRWTAFIPETNCKRNLMWVRYSDEWRSAGEKRRNWERKRFVWEWENVISRGIVWGIVSIVLWSLFVGMGISIGPRAQAADGVRYAPVIPEPAFPGGRITVEEGSIDAETPSEEDAENEELLPNLRGVVFVNHPWRVEIVSPEIAGVHVGEGSVFAFTQWSEFRPMIEAYLDKPLTGSDLKRMEKQITQTYRRHGISVAQLRLPKQDAGNGTLQLLLIEGRLGTVEVQGTKYYDPDEMAAALWSKPGYYMDENDIREDTFWLSRNPFLEVKPRVDQDPETRELELIYDVKDRFPLMVTGGYMDTGTRGTMRERILTGVTAGNLLRQRDLLNYQLIASPDYRSLVSHSFLWSTPIDSTRNQLTLRGNYATLDPSEEMDGMTWSSGFSLARPLWVNVVDGWSKETEKYRVATVDYGFDFLHTNTNLDYGGTSVFSQPVETAIWSTGFTWTQVEKRGVVRFGTSLYLSPGGFSRYNSNPFFREFSGRNARADYFFATLDWDAYRRCGAFDLHTRMFGQFSSGALISYDQMGLGGISSVRGYDAYTEESDGGLNVSIEILTPTYEPTWLDTSFKNSLWRGVADDTKGNLQYFAFFDYALGVNHKNDSDSGNGSSGTNEDSEETTFDLAGVGVGGRYTYGRWVSVDTAYGFQLIEPTQKAYSMTGRPHIIVSISR